jgi:acyl-CoA ligase (AMP-forming) (exosortase A-associated)
MHPLGMPDLLDSNRTIRPGAPAVIHGERAFTYGEVAEECDAWAAWLAALGVGRGDRVGIHLAKSAEEIILVFAAARLGATSVNINASLKPFQVRHIVGDAGISTLICDRMRLPGLLNDGLLDRVKVVIVSGTDSPDPRVLCSAERPPLPPFAGPKPIDRDLAALFYTSGSTGRPKGVAFTHGNVLAGANAVAGYLNNTADDRILSVLPLSFDYGFSQVTTAFLVGATVVLQPVPMAAEIVKAVKAHAVTGLASVPPTWIELTRYLIESGTRLPSLRYITNSGGGISRATLERMPAAFGGTDIYLMYGLTEAFRATYLEPRLFASKMGAIGKAIPGTDVFVVDPESGLCGPGETGELVQRGPLISKGYWNRPEDTAAKIRPDPHLAHRVGDEPVLHSGDNVYADADGILWFVGRNDAMIKSSGYRVSPQEIEEFVVSSGLVREAVAFGVADDELGQTIGLAVVWAGEPATEALIRQCRTGLPAYMVPSTIHTWPATLPRTPSGKYDRPAIAATATGDARGHAKEASGR